MNATRIAAIVLLLAGALGLAYGGFSYTSETHTAKLGPLEMTVKERETVNIPAWLGVAAIVAGVVLLIVPRKG